MAEINEQNSSEVVKKGPNKNGANRQPDGKFGPGNIANPEGRPKGSFSLVALLKKELEEETINTPEGKITLARALIKKALKKAIQEEDVQMIKDIINRIDGMPKQAIEISEIDGIKTNNDIFEEDEN